MGICASRRTNKGDRMSPRFRTSILMLAVAIAFVALAIVSAAGQARPSTPAKPAAKTAPAAKTVTPPKTPWGDPDLQGIRSEEHTSELQSQSNLVCRLLL